MNLNSEQHFELVRLYSAWGMDAAKEYDARLFWLSGGAITLSAAGAQALRQLHPLLLVGMLGFGMLLLLAALGVVMASFRMTTRAAGFWVDWHLNASEPSLREARAIEGRAEPLGMWSLLLVVSGLLLIGLFFVVNLML